MDDLLYVGLTLLFFVLSVGFIVLCERLMEEKYEPALSHHRRDCPGLLVYLLAALAETGVVRMNINGWLQLILYLVVLLALAKPLGAFMARVYQGERTFLDPVLRPVERLIYRAVRRAARRRDGLEDLCHRDAALQRRWACWPCMRLQRLQACCR